MGLASDAINRKEEYTARGSELVVSSSPGMALGIANVSAAHNLGHSVSGSQPIQP
jgi:alcohol dehydrogenase class IV